MTDNRKMVTRAAVPEINEGLELRRATELCIGLAQQLDWQMVSSGYPERLNVRTAAGIGGGMLARGCDVGVDYARHCCPDGA